MLALAVIFKVVLAFLTAGLLSGAMLGNIPSGFVLRVPPCEHPRVFGMVMHSVFSHAVFILKHTLVATTPTKLVVFVVSGVFVNSGAILVRYTSFLSPFTRLLKLSNVVLLTFVLNFPTGRVMVPVVVVTCAKTSILASKLSLRDVRSLFVTGN